MVVSNILDQKRCTSCHTDKPLDEFHRCARNRDGRKAECASCGCERSKQNWRNPDRRAKKEEWMRNNPDAVAQHQRAAKLKSQYGITLDEYADMMIAQSDRCAICNELSETTLCVDHNHDTGSVRGLLCGNCNNGLGRFKDDPERLEAAARYLRENI